MYTYHVRASHERDGDDDADHRVNAHVPLSFLEADHRSRSQSAKRNKMADEAHDHPEASSQAASSQAASSHAEVAEAAARRLFRQVPGHKMSSPTCIGLVAWQSQIFFRLPEKEIQLILLCFSCVMFFEWPRALPMFDLAPFIVRHSPRTRIACLVRTPTCHLCTAPSPLSSWRASTPRWATPSRAPR